MRCPTMVTYSVLIASIQPLSSGRDPSCVLLPEFLPLIHVHLLLKMLNPVEGNLGSVGFWATETKSS